MKKLRHKTTQSESGFSLVEMLVVVAIILILTAIAIPSIKSMMREARNRQAFETVLTMMRRAHEIAVDRRRVVKLVFAKAAGSNPAQITMTQEVRVLGTGGNPNTFATAPAVNSPNPETVQLPSDTDFMLPPSPGPATGPDGFGSPPTNAIDYGYNASGGSTGLTTMYFQADGTVLRDSEVGASASGVLYIGRTNDKNSYRAISILGDTSRVKAWRFDQGSTKWLQQ